MKRHTVFFAFSEDEVEAGLSYSRKNAAEVMHVMAPTISAQLHLAKQGLPIDEYYTMQFSSKSFYKTVLEKEYKQGLNITSSSRRYLRMVTIFGIPLFDIFQTFLETEFSEVLHAYYLYKKIEQKWNPSYYLFPVTSQSQFSGLSPNFFSVASIIKEFFVPQNRKRYVEIPINSRTWFKRKIDRMHFLLLNIKRNTLLLPSLWERFISTMSHESMVAADNYDFLLFSGGVNLFYYQRLFACLKKSHSDIKGLIISPKQSLADESLLSKARIPFVPLETFASAEVNKRIKREVEQAKFTMENFLDSPQNSIENIFSSKISVAEKQAMKKKLILIFERYLEKFTKQTALATEAMEKIKPRLVITTHDPGPSALPFVYLAKSQRRKSLVLLHGLHHSVYGTKYESDHAAVWGEKMRQWYVVNLKKDIHAIHAVGFPFLDNLFLKYSQKLLKRQHIRFSQPISVGILTAYYHPTYPESKFFYELFAAASLHTDKIRFGIRGHPGQHFPDGEAVAKHFRVRASFNESISLDEFVQAYDMLVTWDTTAMLWAMIHGKPLFLAPPWWGPGQIPVEKYNSAWIPKSADDLLQQILSLPKRDTDIKKLQQGQIKFLKDMVGSLEGNSSEKHADLIEKLVYEGKMSRRIKGE